MSDRAIVAKITRTGMRAVFNAANTGLALQLSHIAVGTAAGNGYVPTGNEVALRGEFQRAPIGGGDYVSDFEILVQAMLDGPAQGWIKEVGIFDENGKLFAVWSEVNAPLAYKSNGVPVIIAMTLALSEIPPNSIELIVGGPNVNITIASPFALLSAELLRLQRRAVESENARLTPEINARFY